MPGAHFAKRPGPQLLELPRSIPFKVNLFFLPHILAFRVPCTSLQDLYQHLRGQHRPNGTLLNRPLALPKNSFHKLILPKELTLDKNSFYQLTDLPQHSSEHMTCMPHSASRQPMPP